MTHFWLTTEIDSEQAMQLKVKCYILRWLFTLNQQKERMEKTSVKN